MLTRKPCKYCDSLWHSKSKCPNSPDRPLKAVYKAKGTFSRLEPESPSERPRLAYKGDSERSQLIGYADKFFSIYIRTKGGDGFSNWCYTCDVKLPYGDLQCGHFINRRFLKVRWNEMNCHPQCNECNVDKHGNLKVYERRLRAEYGDSAVDGLRLLANQTYKVTAEDIKAIIEQYKGVVF